MEVILESGDLFPFKFGAIIYNNHVGHPKFTDNIFYRNFSTLLYVMLMIASASTHLMKYFYATMTKIFYALANEKGPKMYNPY